MQVTFFKVVVIVILCFEKKRNGLQYLEDSIIIWVLQTQWEDVPTFGIFEQTYQLPAQLRWKVFIYAEMVLNKKILNHSATRFPCYFQTFAVKSVKGL